MELSGFHQYLSFSLDGERYAVRIDKVQEVLEYTHITRLPRTSDFLKGIINLRGAGVPVIDLRLKFGMSETPIGKDTSIIVMEIENEDETAVVGALADEVHEVVELPASALEPPPSFGTRLAVDYIQGIAKHEDGFIVVLDVDRIMETEVNINSAEMGETTIPEVATAEAIG